MNTAGARHAVGILLATTLLGLASTGARAQEDAWLVADSTYDWSFPRDHWARPGYRTEWWYLTGHLEDAADPSRLFGYQFTMFRVGLRPVREASPSAWSTSDMVMGHAAVIDLSTGERVFSEVLYRAGAGLGGFPAYPEGPLAWSRAPPGTDGRWEISWSGDGFDLAMQDQRRGIALRLRTEALKARVFQGPDGFSRKARRTGAASQYYSFTRLRTEGTLTVARVPRRVSGVSWMDKEFGSNQLGEDQVGWDWLSLQLNDGREVMLYLLRDESGDIDYRSGTVIAPDGAVRYLPPRGWSVEAGRRWRSRETDARYPVEWTIDVPDLELTLHVEAEHDAQENVSELVPGLSYWEGAVRVRAEDGSLFGRGFVELTGYGTSELPAF